MEKDIEGLINYVKSVCQKYNVDIMIETDEVELSGSRIVELKVVKKR